MQLQHRFEVPVTAERAWATLTDLERVGTCLPGASIERRGDAEYAGRVRIKVGPIATDLEGTAWFEQQDVHDLSAIIRLSASDRAGRAKTEATIAARLIPLGTTTTVELDTALTVTGRLAQLGGHAITEVSNRLLGQFAQNLSVLLSADGVGTPAAAGTATSAERAGSQLDLLQALMPPRVARAAVFVAGAVAGIIVGYLADQVYRRTADRAPLTAG